LKKSSQAATISYSTLFLNEQDMTLVQHLKGLIRAADDFHASASTTASTVAGSPETRIAPSEFEDDQGSAFGTRLPSMKLKQIETYLSSTNQQNVRPRTSGSDREEEGVPKVVPLEEANANPKQRGVDPNHTFSTIFIGGFSKIAQRALQQLDLQQADALLKEALKWYESSGSKDPSHRRHLQTQLALCSLLQGNRQKAQELILYLIDSNTEADTVPHQLLYALILLQLHELDFEGARDNSKRLWESLQETRCTVLGANDAMRLLATSYQESGDSLLANAIEAEVPGLKLCEPVPKMVDFLVDCEEVLVKSFGFQGCAPDVNSTSVVQKMHNLPIARKSSSLQMRKMLLSDKDTPLSESESGTSTLERGLSFKTSPNSAQSPLKTKKRSWSHLRTLFKARITRAASSMDLSALYGTQDAASDTAQESVPNTDQKGCRCSAPKSIKRIKRSHTTTRTSQEAFTDCDIPSVSDNQSPVVTRQSTSAREPAVIDRGPDSDRTLRTEEWIRSQDDILSSSTIIERDNDPEESCSLRRQFSFQAGVPDCISGSFSGIQQTMCHELQNTAVFELMDTSLPVELPAEIEALHDGAQRESTATPSLQILMFNQLKDDTSLSSSCEQSGACAIPQLKPRRMIDDAIETISSDMESEIYDLLGNLEPKCEAENPETSITARDISDATVMRGDSPKDNQPSQPFLPESPDFLFSKAERPHETEDEGPPEGSVGSANNKQLPDFEEKNETVVQISFFGSTDPHRDTAISDYTPTPLRIRASKYRYERDVKMSQNLKSQCRASQDFALPFAKLCRRNGLHKLPRRTTSTKRLSGIAAAKLRRLFDTEKRGHDFDFGFNRALYSGPDAVIGPFTDLEDTEALGGARSICGPTPQNTPISVFT
jgi:hypothetical protein